MTSTRTKQNQSFICASHVWVLVPCSTIKPHGIFSTRKRPIVRHPSGSLFARRYPNILTDGRYATPPICCVLLQRLTKSKNLSSSVIRAWLCHPTDIATRTGVNAFRNTVEACRRYTSIRRPPKDPMRIAVYRIQDAPVNIGQVCTSKHRSRSTSASPHRGNLMTKIERQHAAVRGCNAMWQHAISLYQVYTGTAASFEDKNHGTKVIWYVT